MIPLHSTCILCVLLPIFLSGQPSADINPSPSFQTYLNPVIPGDHPDPTLTRVGNDFYTSGSSFNPTPKIYHSTNLVHWEVIAQPVAASWSTYGNTPGGGIWGGHLVYYHEQYWHFFGRGGGSMYFVTADHPEGPWSEPIQLTVPSGVPDLGVDNSIFIDDESGKWYLLTKAGRENNHIIELGADGQASGTVFDLTWINPDSLNNPYGWAEGPVMWKRGGYYYYSFAQHLVGEQYVMRSDTLTDDPDEWTIKEGSIFVGDPAVYRTPNHIAPVVMLDDSTSWTFAQSYHSSTSWYAQGRQGILCQVNYDEEGFPVIAYPSIDPAPAPHLPSGNLPWTVARPDGFNDSVLKPDWSFLGRTDEHSYNTTAREGWLYMEGNTGSNTVIQIEGEHHFSLVTRLDFEPETVADEAGLRIINGPQSHAVKVYSTMNNEGDPILAFSFEETIREVPNTLGSIVWLKLVRNQHRMAAFYSADGIDWNWIGHSIDAIELDREQDQFNDFTGNQQGLYVTEKGAYFDLYIYRDAYTTIPARDPANAWGVRSGSEALEDIDNNDWSMYPAVTFSQDDYPMEVTTLFLEAAGLSGGAAEVWVDSIGTGKLIATCIIEPTDDEDTYQLFSTEVEPISGTHDVYLRYTGSATDELFKLRSLRFLHPGSPRVLPDEPAEPEPLGALTGSAVLLSPNFPNPFDGTTEITYTMGKTLPISLKLFTLSGQVAAVLFEGTQNPGTHHIRFEKGDLPAGVYIFELKGPGFTERRKWVAE